MSGATFDEARDALIALMEARRCQGRDGKAECDELVKRMGGCESSELKALNDPAAYEQLIAEALERAGKPPRLAPTFAHLKRFLGSLQGGKCTEEDKARFFATMAATPDLSQTTTDQFLELLKSALPGKPRLESLRRELKEVQLRAYARRQGLPKDAQMLVFREHESDTVWGGVYDPAADKFVDGLKLTALKGFAGLEQLCGKFGVPPIAPAQMEFGIRTFNPGKAPQVIKTAAGYEVNQWTRSEVSENAVPSDTVPPAIRKLLLHVLGDDEKVYERFVNWLAVAYQTNDRTGTAWILSGRTGTGKGVLFDEVITQLWGADYCVSLMAKNLEDQFNTWAKKCLMLCLNEAEVIGPQAPHVEGKLRNQITDPTVPVREMHKAVANAANHSNVILCSNSVKPVRVTLKDRRYNVAPRQEKELEDGNATRLAALITAVRNERRQFAGYLASCPIDIELASKPMQTAQRDILMENSTTTPERIVHELKSGNLDYFLDAYWVNTDNAGGEVVYGRDYTLSASARRVLLAWARAANPAGATRLKETGVTAARVAAVHNFLLSDSRYTKSSYDMGRFLGSCGFEATKRCGESRVRGYPIHWRTKETATELAKIIHELEHPEPAAQAEFESEPEEPTAPKKPRARKPAQPSNARVPQASPSLDERATVLRDVELTTGPSEPAAAPASEPTTMPNGNAVDMSWKKLPCKSHELKCPNAKVKAARAAFARFGIEIRGTKLGANNTEIFAVSMPTDVAAYKALLAKVIAEFNEQEFRRA